MADKGRRQRAVKRLLNKLAGSQPSKADIKAIQGDFRNKLTGAQPTKAEIELLHREKK